MTDKIQKIREDVSKLIIPESECNGMSLMEKGRQYAYREVLGIIDSTSEEPVSEDLEEAAMMHFKDVMEYEVKTGLKMANMTSFKAGANWQKSLRPQNLWKPSKGQMDALLWCVAHLGGADHRVLGELYEHLKQLREE